MSSFRNDLDRARTTKSMRGPCVALLRCCVARYCRLTGYSFIDTLWRLAAASGFRDGQPPTTEQFFRALAFLEAERELYLRKLAAFERGRRERKRTGRRLLARAEVRQLRGN